MPAFLTAAGSAEPALLGFSYQSLVIAAFVVVVDIVDSVDGATYSVENWMSGSARSGRSTPHTSNPAARRAGAIAQPQLSS